MPARLPPLHTLQAFEAICRLGSFSQAAHELHLTHSAISHQIRALEESLQTSLIDRSRRMIAITPTGLQFLEVVRPLLDKLSEITDEIRQPVAQRLSMSVLPSFAGRWLLPRLGAFLAQCPGLDVDVSATQSIVRLHRGGVNLAIRYGTGPWPGVVAERLAEETFFPVASPAYLTRHRIRTLGDLPKGVLLRDSDHPWDELLGLARIPPGDCQFGAVYHDSALGLQAAEAGQGIALGRSWLVADAIKRGTLSPIGEIQAKSPAAYFLVYPKGGEAARPVQAFRSWIFEEMALASRASLEP